MNLTKTLAERVASRMRRDGFECSAADVFAVARHGYFPPDFNAVGDSGDALASRILQEFEELGIDA